MSKVIFNMRFDHPNLPSSSANNAGHAYYIATRPGVDKTMTHKDLLGELKASGPDLPNTEIYAKYLNERPGSHGLFNQDGTANLQETMDYLKKKDTVVWRCVVSLKEEDAVALGYTDKEKWQDLVRDKIFDVADNMGIRPTNLDWVAAVHMEKGHPHTHIMFWEKTPERMIGMVPVKNLNQIRKVLTDAVFEDERLLLLQTKNAMRDLLLEDIRGKAVSISTIMKEIKEGENQLKAFSPWFHSNSIEPRMYEDKEAALMEMFKELSKIMPGEGRVALKFMPEDVKEKVAQIAKYLMDQPDFASTIERGVRSAVDLAGMYTGKEEALSKVRENTLNDYQRRISQLVLKTAVEWKETDFLKIDKAKGRKVIELIKSTDKGVDIKSEHAEILKEISGHLKLASLDKEDALNVLSQYAEEIGSYFSKEELEAIYEESIALCISGPGYKKGIEGEMFILNSIGLNNRLIELIDNQISNNEVLLQNKISEHIEAGLIRKSDLKEEFEITHDVKKEYLLSKKMNPTERKIIEAILDADEGISREQFLENEDVMENIVDKEKAPFKLSVFDFSIYEAVDRMSFSLNDIQKYVVESFPSEKEKDKIKEGISNNDVQMSEEINKTYEIYASRIRKMAVNGFLSYSPTTNKYSWAEGLEEHHFKQTQDVFTRYDASVTLGYIDKMDGYLNVENLIKLLYEDELVVHRSTQKANAIYDDVQALYNNQSEFINVENGVVSLNEEGIKYLKTMYFLSNEFKDLKCVSLNALNQNIDKMPKGRIKFHYASMRMNVESLIRSGYFKLDQRGNVVFDKVMKSDLKSISNLRRYTNIDLLNREKCIDELVFKDIEFSKYRIIKRFNLMCEEKYLEKEVHSRSVQYYSITDEGAERRRELLEPGYKILKDTLMGLCETEVIQWNYNDLGNIVYTITDHYKDAVEIKKDPSVESKIDSELSNVLDESYRGKIDMKAHINYLHTAKNELIHDQQASRTCENYEEMRKHLKVHDRTAFVVDKLSQMLLTAGQSVDETKMTIRDWAKRTNVNVNEETLDLQIEKAVSKFKDKEIWHRLNVISKKDWEKTFEYMGIKNIPAWYYKAPQSFASIINAAWKGAWNELKRQEQHKEASSKMMRKMQIKQKGMDSKSAKKEAAKKSKDGLYHDIDHENER